MQPLSIIIPVGMNSDARFVRTVSNLKHPPPHYKFPNTGNREFSEFEARNASTTMDADVQFIGVVKHTHIHYCPVHDLESFMVLFEMKETREHFRMKTDLQLIKLPGCMCTAAES